jgi:hypothetical protein
LPGATADGSVAPMDDSMPPLQKRPDLRTRSPRFTSASILWIGAGGVVGFIGIRIVLSIQDTTGSIPATSTFAAAAIVMSFVAIVTVAAATRASGASWRAAIAMGGGFAAIAIAKFGMGPTALIQGNRTEVIQNAGGATSGGMVVVIAVAVGLLYVITIWLLAVLLRPAPPPDGPSGKAMLALIPLLAVAVIGSALVTSAAGQYIAWALTGLEAAGIAVALFVAAGLVTMAFHDTAARSKALGTTSMYITVVWIAIAFLLVFQVLWIVFLIAIVAIWPFKSVTPK